MHVSVAVVNSFPSEVFQQLSFSRVWVFHQNRSSHVPLLYLSVFKWEIKGI